MADQITNYQCPACNGPLHFSSELGKLKCDYCDSVFEVEEIEALYKKKDEKAEEAFEKAEQEQQTATVDEFGDPIQEEPEPEECSTLDGNWDESTISADWGEDYGKMRAYNCPSCGAELICEETTAATHCPYCGNPSIVPGQFKGALKPDYIIPFALDKKAAEQALKNHYRKRLFLPGTFSNGNQIKKLQGIYVPFWLFDATATANCRYEGTTSTSHREGDYIVTNTQHYDVRRSGSVEFRRVPTDASKKMPDDLMDSIEPFDYSDLKPFSTAYLPGYLADKYDVSIEQDAHRADTRCRSTTGSTMRNSVTGYSSVRTISSDMNIIRGKVHYALLPVWTIKTQWEGKTYLFAMNGQTGKFIGNLPVSKKRFLAFCGGLGVALSIILYLLGVGPALADILTSL